MADPNTIINPKFIPPKKIVYEFSRYDLIKPQFKLEDSFSRLWEVNDFGEIKKIIQSNLNINKLNIDNNGNVEIVYLNGNKKFEINGELNEKNQFISLKVNGKKIDFLNCPIGEKQFSLTLNNLFKSLETINNDIETKKLIKNDTEFKCSDGYRIEFSVIDANKKNIDLVVTPEDIFKIKDKEVKLTDEENERLKKLEKEESEILPSAELPPDGLNDTQFEIWSRKQEEKEKGKEPYKVREKKWLACRNKISDLHNKNNSSLLGSLDPNDLLIIYEKTGKFSFTRMFYVNSEKKIEKEYKKNNGVSFLDSVFIYENNKLNEVIKYDPKGKILSKLKYDENEDLIHTDEYLNGKLASRTLNNDKKDKLFAFRITGKIVLLNPFNDDFEKSINQDPVTFLKAQLDTKEKYDYFESLYLENLNSPSSLNYEKQKMFFSIREHGKALYGVLELEEKLKKNNIDLSFTTELKPNRRVNGTVKLSPIKEYSKELPKIVEMISIYPPQFLQYINLRNVFAYNHIQLYNHDFPIGGFFSSEYPDSLFITTKEDGLKDDFKKHLTHHEISHQGDFADGGLKSDDYDWVNSFHGNQKNVYGKFYEKFNFGSVSMVIQVDSKDFARPYGRHTVDEDQATISETFFLKDKYESLKNRGNTEVVLLEKINRIERFYLRISGGRMDKKFWEDLRSGVKVDQKYWEEREKNGDFNNEMCEKFLSYMKCDIEMREQEADIERLKNQKKYPDLIKIYESATLRNPYNYSYFRDLNFAFDLMRAKPQDRTRVLLPLYENRFNSIPEIDHVPSFYEDYGSVLFESGEKNKAIEIYEKGIKKFPRDLILIRKLIGSLDKMVDSTENTEEKNVYIEKIFFYMDKLFQRDIFIRDINLLTDLSKKFSCPEKLVNPLKEYLKQNPDDDKQITAFEELMFSLNKSNEIVDLYKSKIKDDPKYLILLARFYTYQLNDFYSSETLLEEAKKKTPDQNTLTECLAQFQFQIEKERKSGNESKANDLINKTINFIKDGFPISKDIKIAREYLSFIEKYGSRDVIISELNNFFNNFKSEYADYQNYTEENTKPDQINSFLYIYESQIPRMISVYERENNVNEAITFLEKMYEVSPKNCSVWIPGTLLLLYEKNNQYDKGIAFSNELLKNKSIERKHHRIENQKIYFELLKSGTSKWQKFNNVEYAISKHVPKTLFMKNKNEYYMATRWEKGVGYAPNVSSNQFTDEIYWGENQRFEKIDIKKLPNDIEK